MTPEDIAEVEKELAKSSATHAATNVALDEHLVKQTQNFTGRSQPFVGPDDQPVHGQRQQQAGYRAKTSIYVPSSTIPRTSQRQSECFSLTSTRIYQPSDNKNVQNKCDILEVQGPSGSQRQYDTIGGVNTSGIEQGVKASPECYHYNTRHARHHAASNSQAGIQIDVTKMHATSHAISGKTAVTGPETLSVGHKEDVSSTVHQGNPVGIQRKVLIKKRVKPSGQGYSTDEESSPKPKKSPRGRKPGQC